MAVKIRLRRTGKRNAPAHRIVVADQRCPRDGRFIETIGMYDPRAKIEKIDLERVEYWISQGAQTSETVDGIIKRARDGVSLYDRRLKREAEERRQAEEEEARKQAEAEERRKAEEEEARKQAAEEARRKAEEEAGKQAEAESGEAQDSADQAEQTAE